MKIFVKVKPGASEDKLEKISENDYLGFVRDLPVNGKANINLKKLIAREFGVSSKDIVINNPTSRKKIIEVQGK